MVVFTGWCGRRGGGGGGGGVGYSGQVMYSEDIDRVGRVEARTQTGLSQTSRRQTDVCVTITFDVRRGS